MSFRNEELSWRDYENVSELTLKRMFKKDVAIDPGSIAAATSTEQAVTIPGVEVGDIVIAMAPASLENDIAVSAIRVSAADTVQLRFSNIDNTNAIDGASRTWTFLVLDLT
jgi:hypothetical protein